jgi:hypothetical protein
MEEKGWTVEQCLDRYPRNRAELEPLLRTALKLRKARQLRPSLEFRSNAQPRFRSRLRTSRRSSWRSLSKSAVPRSRQGNAFIDLLQNLGNLQWATALILIIIILVGTGGGVAYAADNAKPGDFLYQMDKGIEQLRIELENDIQDLVRLRVQFANERLDEATQLLAAGDTDEIIQVIQDYKELMAAAAPMIAEAHIAGEDVQPLVRETNDAIYTQEKKLEELIKTAPIEVEEVIKLTLKDVKDIQILVVAPLPTILPTADLSPIPFPSTTLVGAPSTSSPQPPQPTLYPTSTGTLIPGHTPTIVGSPYATPTPGPSGTPTATTNPYATTTPTGTITSTPTRTPGPTYSPTPTRTKTPYPVTPTATGTLTATPGPATQPPGYD